MSLKEKLQEDLKSSIYFFPGAAAYDTQPV